MCSKHVHSTVTHSSRFHCLICVINKPTTVELCISRGRLKRGTGKRWTMKNAGVENAGLENVGPNRRGRKDGTGKHGTKAHGWNSRDAKTQDQISRVENARPPLNAKWISIKLKGTL